VGERRTIARTVTEFGGGNTMKKPILILALILTIPLVVPRGTRADVAADDARDVYTGNGSTTTFTYNFKVLTSANIAVYQAGTLKTLTTHYTVTGVGNDAGGTVVFVTAPAASEQIVLLRNQPIEQITSYVDGAISASTIERDFDRQTAINQQQQETIERALRYPITITPTSGLTLLPTPVAEKCIGYDGAGTALALYACGGGGGGAAFTTSAGLAGILTDETGTGLSVFNDSPTFTTQITAPKHVWTGAVADFQGSGSPEGVITAAVGSTYRRHTDGGAATTFYVKESGAGNTGWVAYGSPAGSGAPTTATYITQTGDGTLSNEQALSSLTTGIVKVTNGTGVLSTAVLNTDYLSPASPVTNGQLPSTISSKTLDNSNTVTVQDINLTVQDNSDNTKQVKFDVAGVTTGTTRTLAVPNSSTRLMGDSDFSGTQTGVLERTGTATYTVIKNNTSTSAPTANDDTTAGYAIGSMWLNTTTPTWYRATSVGTGTATWQNLGATTEVDTLQTVMTRGNVATAESFAAGLQIQNSGGTVKFADFIDPTFGPRRQCSPECDSVDFIPTNKVHRVYDQEGAADVFTIDPDAASKNAMYQFGANYRPLKSVSLPAGALSTDGTQCAAPAEVTINSGAKRWTIICADNDASTIYGEVEMPDAWDGSTVTMMGRFIQTAADTANMHSDVAMACRSDNDTINNTWGTEVAMDTAMTGSNGTDTVTTGAITPNGTCTGGGKLLQFRWQLDAAGTTTAVATLHVLGFKIEYGVTSLSD
jgi:hypothetical protein